MALMSAVNLPIRLQAGVVEVWFVALEGDADLLARCESELAPAERKRAAAFISLPARNEFITTRAVLRRLLSRYLHCAPSAVDFGVNAYGKPHLTDTSAGRNVRFNVAHSGGLAGLAFDRNADVGIDVELRRNDLEFDEIAGRFFAPAEVAAFRGVSKDQQVRAFYDCWTRKEAFIKARGLGLSMPLDQFVVSLAPVASAALLSIDGDTTAARQWVLQDLGVEGNYAAALAVNRPATEVRCTHVTLRTCLASLEG